jgi:hypothetical protein
MGVIGAQLILQLEKIVSLNSSSSLCQAQNVMLLAKNDLIWVDKLMFLHYLKD